MADLLQTGTAVETYEIRGLFRRDNTCAEYLAVVRGRDRSVIIKEYFPQALARRVDGTMVSTHSPAEQAQLDAGLGRFLAQHRTLRRIAHDALQNVQECFRANGTGYAVLDHCEGETLLVRLERDKTLPVAGIHSVLFPIIDGLERVHGSSLLHCRIDPANILIRGDGSPMLSGFGTTPSSTAGPRQAFGARESDADLPSGGFAALEQYSRRGRRGPWTDIYSLGAVMYRCVCGVAPPDAPERAVHDDLEPAAALAKGPYDPHLLAGIGAALALRVVDRPRSVAVWRRSLTSSAVEQGGARMARGRMAARGPVTAPRATPHQENVRSSGVGNAGGHELEPRNISWSVPALVAAVFIVLLTWLDTGILRSAQDGRFQESTRAGEFAVLDGLERIPRHDPTLSAANQRVEALMTPSALQPGGMSRDGDVPPAEPHELATEPTGAAVPDLARGANRDAGTGSDLSLPHFEMEGPEGAEAPGGGQSTVPATSFDSEAASVDALGSDQSEGDPASRSLPARLDLQQAAREQPDSITGLKNVSEPVLETLEPGQDRAVTDARYGSLTLDLSPPGATVTFVGNAAMRYRPGMELPEGEHRIRVDLLGHRPENRVILVSGDTRVQVALSPEPQPFFW